MALARKKNFPEKDIWLADWCKALAHPARIEILRSLANRGECICGELVLELPLAQSTVSQHLKALKKAGLIKGKIDGPRSRYCVNKDHFNKFLKIFQEFGLKLNDDLDDLKC